MQVKQNKKKLKLFLNETNGATSLFHLCAFKLILTYGIATISKFFSSCFTEFCETYTHCQMVYDPLVLEYRLTVSLVSARNHTATPHNCSNKSEKYQCTTTYCTHKEWQVFTWNAPTAPLPATRRRCCWRCCAIVLQPNTCVYSYCCFYNEKKTSLRADYLPEISTLFKSVKYLNLHD